MAPKACVNCGDPARIGAATVGMRAKLGYCTNCFKMWEQNGGEDASRQAQPESERPEKSYIRKTPFDSRGRA